MDEDRYKRLKASAQRYTAYRERAPKEVADKLAEWDAPQIIIDRILKELLADKFIDEERFARAFCHDKFLVNKWGKRKISMELSRYKLSAEAKEQGLD
ncbi:MAG: RecX family transcriptional regulator, partial [Cyclobacteriaceae bacterium]